MKALVVQADWKPKKEYYLTKDEEGYILFSGQVKLPGIIGHEFSGIVEKTGRRVVHLKIGDAVTAESILWCGLCSPCRRGALNQCQSLDLLGLSSNGALA